MSEGIVHILKGREKPIRNQHPWIFSGAISKAEKVIDGEIVTVVDHAGRFLGRGYWNRKSQIQVRLLTWQDEPIDEAWWGKMLQRAVQARFSTRNKVDCQRLVNAENDYLAGLVVDRYANWLVLQALTLYIDRNKEMIAKLLQSIMGELSQDIRGIYERSDVDVRGKEGLKQVTGVLLGDEPPQKIRVYEDQLTSYWVDIKSGHKTGFYLDQKQNRTILREFIRDDFSYKSQHGHRVLNLFSYTGGFGVAAFMGKPTLKTHVTNVDTSNDALELAKENFSFNASDLDNSTYQEHIEFIQADVFNYLHDCVERGEQFDIVVLDPPKFAQNKQQIDSAARGYKDINLNAFKIIKSGGYLMTFSCSGAISRDLFQKIVFGALADSGRQAQIIKHLSASDDHPIALTFPEGEYLKGLLLRVY